MNTRITPRVRHDFYVRHCHGESYEQIAKRFGLSKACVRYWCRRQRDGGGCASTYRRSPAGMMNRFDPRVRYVILRLRKELPRLGPNGILTKLRKWPSLRGLVLSSLASIGRYLHQWPCFRREGKSKEKRPRPRPPMFVHQCWQIDFKLDIALPGGARANLMTVWDPSAKPAWGLGSFRRKQLANGRTG